MATLSEERTDVLGESGSSEVEYADVDRGLVFDDLLLHRPGRVGMRMLVVLVVALVLGLGMWATGAATVGGAANDCFLISGVGHGGVTIVPGCDHANTAPVRAVALQSEADSVMPVVESAAGVSPRLWVPIPRLVVDLVGGLLG